MALFSAKGQVEVGLVKSYPHGRFDIFGRMNKTSPGLTAINKDLSNFRGRVRSSFVPFAAKQLGTTRNSLECNQKTSTTRRVLLWGPAVASRGGSTACHLLHWTRPRRVAISALQAEHESAPGEQKSPGALVPATDVSTPPQGPPDFETWAPSAGLTLLGCGFFLCDKSFCFFETKAFLMFFLLWVGAMSIILGWQLLKTTRPSSAHFRPREPGLPPDWHNLYDPETGRPFYYNTATGTARWDPPALLHTAPVGGGTLLGYAFHGAWHQLTGLAAPVATAGLYYSLLRTALWCFGSCFGPIFIGQDLLTRLGLSALLLALPVPLPSLILQLSSLSPARLSPGAPLPSAVEAALCFALSLSLLPSLLSFVETARAAALARLPYKNLAWDAPSLARLLAAACPAVAWLTRPSALLLRFSRVVFFPLPFGYLLRVPVPRWELLGRSLTGVLFAATIALPLARMVAARSSDVPSMLKALWESKAVRIGVCVSVLSHLTDRQKDAYVAALKESSADEDAALETVDDLERKAFEDFDRKLGDGTPV